MLGCVGEKGGVSVYGLGRFPVTLYYEQWVRMLDASEDLRAFVENNKDKLKLKQKWLRRPCVDPSLWKPEGGSYRSDDGIRRVAVFYEDSDRDLRVEVSIAIDRLPDFYNVPDHSLGAKRDRAETVLRAMLDQFLSQDPDIRSGELKRIGEQDVDVAPIINQFQQSRQTNTWKQNA